MPLKRHLVWLGAAALLCVLVAGDAVAQDTRRNHFGSRGAMCLDACGKGCPGTCEIKRYNECTPDGLSKLVVTRHTCGTHQGCRDHDTCLENCVIPYTYGNVPGTDLSWADLEFVLGECQQICHFKALFYAERKFGESERETIVTSWARGHGPFDGSINFEYTRNNPDGPDETEPCGECEVCFGGACLPNPDCEPCNTCGDVHIYSLDDLAYDFQASGEFVLLESDDGRFVAQVRQEPLGSAVSVNTAVAFLVGGDRVGMYADRGLLLNGQPLGLQPDESIDLPGGGKVIRFPRSLVVIWPNEASAIIDIGSSLNIGFRLPDAMQGQVHGLLGNFDGTPENDLATRTGDAIDLAPSFEMLYRQYGDSWRISADESLFDYEAGKNTATYQRMDFPVRPVHLDNLSADSRRQAEALCRQGGIEGEVAFQNCVFDVAITGDTAFVASALRSPTSVQQVVQLKTVSQAPFQPVLPPQIADSMQAAPTQPIRLSAPERVRAGAAVTISVDKARAYDDLIAIVPVDAPTDRVGSSYARLLARSTVTVYAPNTAGRYEIRYLTGEGERQVLARHPLVVE